MLFKSRRLLWVVVCVLAAVEFVPAQGIPVINDVTATPPGLSQTVVPFGSTPITITVTGRNFISTSQVFLAGQPVGTTFVSSTQLTATAPRAALFGFGNIPVTVVNSGPLTISPSSVSLNISSAIGVGSYQVTINYNRNVVILQQAGVTGGNGAGFTGTPTTVNIDNSAGTVIINAFQTANSPTGTFSVANLTFTAVAAGTSNLTVSGIVLTDTTSHDLAIPPAQVSLTTNALSVSPSASSNSVPLRVIERGDVNGNRSVNIGDALTVARIAAGLDRPALTPAAGDLNFSGSSDIGIVLFLALFSPRVFTNLPEPLITATSPAPAVRGGTLTITGSGFSATAANNQVAFPTVDGFVRIAPASATATSLTITVPGDAVSGPIQVFRLDAGVGGNEFPVTVNTTSTPLILTSISPFERVQPGTPVILTGLGFSTTPANNTVNFRNTSGGVSGATVTAASATSLTVTVPANAACGDVTVTVASQPSNAKSILISGTTCNLRLTHVVTGGAPGHMLVLEGTGFDAITPGNNVVTFAGSGTTVPAPVVQSGGTQLHVYIPPTALTGAITVTVGAATSSLTYSRTGVASLVQVGTSATSATVGSTLNWTIQANTSSGAPIAGVDISFVSTTGNGSVSASTVTTGIDGRASVTLTLGTTAGLNTFQASTATLAQALTLNITGTAGPFNRLVKVSGDAQSGVPGAPLPNALVIAAVDSFLNGIPGISVTFTPGTGGGSVAPTGAQTTDANGKVQVTATLGLSIGIQQFIATAQSTSVTFSEIAHSVSLNTPTLSSINPAAGAVGSAIPVAMTGTNFVPGATAILISGTGVAGTAVSVQSTTALTATVVIAPDASLGSRNVAVVTAGGTSGIVAFVVSAPATSQLYANDFENAPTAFSGWTAAGTLTGLSRISLPSDGGGITSPNQSMWLGPMGLGIGKSSTTSELATLSLTGLVPGVVYNVAFDLLIGGSWDGSAGTYGPDQWKLTAASGANTATLVNATFSNCGVSNQLCGASSPQSYSDATPLAGANGNFAPETGADFFSDVSSNYSQDYGIYYFGHGAGNPVLSFTAGAPTATLTFERLPIASGDSADEYWALDNIIVTTVNTGNGLSGPVTVTTSGTVVNAYAAITDPQLMNGATQVNVDSAAGFAQGDEVLVIQMQQLPNAGTYEFDTISSISGTAITLLRPLTNTYTSSTGPRGAGAGRAAQLVRIPQFTTVNVNGGASITAPAWNGHKGAIVAFRATGSVTISGTVDVSGLGFQGGPGSGPISCSSMPTVTNPQGESIAGIGYATTGAGFGGGGAGNSGQCGIAPAATGGGGSYGTQGTLGGGSSGPAVAGSPGDVYGTPDLGRVYLGSGGGAGGSHDVGVAGNGGAGGGAIFVFAQSLAMSGPGSIRADGSNGTGGTAYGAGGGGGSGGSIYIQSATTATLGSNVIRALGGSGGNSQNTGAVGGSGGLGRIHIQSPTISGTTQPSLDSTPTLSPSPVTGQFISGTIGLNAAITDTQVLNGTASFNVENSSGFAAGDEVLVMQMDQTPQAGNYELKTIASISGNTITLTTPLDNTFTSGAFDTQAPGARAAQLVKVIRFATSVVVGSGDSVRPAPWDGTRGGVLAMRVAGQLTVAGTIDASGRGLRGAVAGGTVPCNNMPSIDNPAGESIFGTGIRVTSNVGSGGGAGNSGVCGTAGGAGGGGGGYGAAGTAGDAGGPQVAGQGGAVIGTPDLTRIFLGSGGGSGGSHDVGTAGGGGSGGGSIVLFANAFTIAGGTVQADGASGTGGVAPAGGGGGGSGGSVYISSPGNVDLGSGRVSANGGAGGIGTGAHGGGGGAGRIRVRGLSINGSSTPPSYTGADNPAPFITGPFINGIVNAYGRVTDSIIGTGTTTINVSDASPFAVGDEVVVVQVQDPSTPGTFESATIGGINGNQITFLTPLLRSYTSGTFNTTASRATQIVKVRRFTADANIGSGAAVTAPPWDGFTGGVVALRVAGELRVAGAINVAGKGFRGGTVPVNTTACNTMPIVTSLSGETLTGVGRVATTVNLSAGGAGNSGLCGTIAAASGGGGGYGTTGAIGEGTSSPAVGGDGGLTSGTADLSRILFGSGGGAGGAHDVGVPGPGGIGGGVIYVNAGALRVTGGIVSSGGDGSIGTGWGGGGGAGSGGSVLINVTNTADIGNSLVNARGGAGGAGHVGNGSPVYGGAGGKGRIKINAASIIGSSDPGTGPTITSVAPSSATAGTQVSVIINGTGFIAGQTSIVVSGTGITVSSISVSSATVVNANFTVAAAATPGPRDVSVATLSGVSAPLAGGFTVTAGSGLVSWWQGNGNIFDTTGANNPSASNGISFVPAVTGLGFSIGSNGFIDIPPSASLANQQFTMAGWVRPDGPGPNNDSEGNKFFGQNFDNLHALSLGWRGTDKRFVFDTGNAATSAIVSQNTFPSGQFHHVAGTYDGATFKLYVDGNLEAQLAEAITIAYSSRVWTIGADSDTQRQQSFPRTLEWTDR